MRNKKVLLLAQSGLIAALYVVFTYLCNMMGIASGVIQVRLSEAMTILPFFTPAAVPGLFIGCLISNTITGAAIWDIIFGSLATLIGAIGTRCLRKVSPWVAPLSPIIANTVIIPFVLIYAYEVPDALWFLMCTVGAGELISCGICGMILYFALKPFAKSLFKSE